MLFLELAYRLLHLQCISINMKALTKANIQIGKQHQMCIGSTPDDSLYFVLGKKIVSWWCLNLQNYQSCGCLSIQNHTTYTKEFRATNVRRLTAATAAITLARLFVEMLCYVLGRLHSNCVLSSVILQMRAEFWMNSCWNSWRKNMKPNSKCNRLSIFSWILWKVWRYNILR